MKEFFGWVKWAWSRQETWQKWWIVGMFFLGAAINAEGLTQKILWAVPISIFAFFLLKWAVWDAFKKSWSQYKEHRNELLTTIKDSDC